ncbi:MAG TPA: hypothetical protein VL501_05780 [Pyrinomonadaceae bacterium]|nr:hypothetical protein [Pyrinomonadaceae bacterium]
MALTGVSVSAQKKTTKGSSKKTTASLVPPLDVRTAREHVDTQLSNVNEFLAKLGPLAPALEQGIADQKAGKLRPQYSQKVDDARSNSVKSLHDIGTALTNLESEFRTKPALAKYRSTVQGISDLGGKAEDSAAAGQFVAAKEPLRDVVQKLTDALAAMPR